MQDKQHCMGQGMRSKRIQALLRVMVALAFAPLILAGCSNSVGSARKAEEKEVTGTEEQRVAEVEGYLLRNVATVWHVERKNNSVIWSRAAQRPRVTLPGKIAHPHFLYVSANSFRNDGDQYFVSFRVPLNDVDKWTAILEPIRPPQPYDGEVELPGPPRAWWVTNERLSRLTFYDPRTLAGLVNGWVGVDRATGEFFVYSFTM